MVEYVYHAATRPLVLRTLQALPRRRPIDARLTLPVRAPFSTRINQVSNGTKPSSPLKQADQAILSENSPPNLRGRVSSLLANAQWVLTEDQKGLYRTYTFKTFSGAWKFMTLVADECKSQRHHPAWGNLYNEVWVTWTTHKPLGLSSKDVDMAEFCDLTAKEIQAKKAQGQARGTPEGDTQQPEPAKA